MWLRFETKVLQKHLTFQIKLIKYVRLPFHLISVINMTKHDISTYSLSFSLFFTIITTRNLSMQGKSRKSNRRFKFYEKQDEFDHEQIYNYTS